MSCSAFPLTFVEISLVLVSKFSPSFVLAANQISYILISISIIKGSESSDGIIFENTVVLKFARMNEVAFPIFLIVFECSIVFIAIRVHLLPVSMLHIVLPSSFIAKSLSIIIWSISLSYIISPLADVDLFIGSFPNSESIFLFILVIPFIILMILLNNFKAKPISFVVFPVTNVNALIAI